MEKTRKLILVGLFSVLITIGAYLKIPVGLVPISLQFFFTTLGGILLGGELGAASVGLYILMGLSGLPVFTGGGGLGYVFYPSFGYIIGFALGAYVSGIISNKVKNPSLLRLVLAGVAGLLIVYFFGALYFLLIKKLYLGESITLYYVAFNLFLIFIPGDLISCVVAGIISKRVLPIIRNVN